MSFIESGMRKLEVQSEKQEEHSTYGNRSASASQSVQHITVLSPLQE